MADSPLSPDSLRRAADELREAPAAARADVDVAARIVAEVLIDQAQHRATVASAAVVDAKVSALGASASIAKTATGEPLEILRGGARTVAERALLSVLMARHLGAMIERRDGVSAVREVLPALDWLEFEGRHCPYTAARETLSGDVLARFDELLSAAPVEAPSSVAIDAIRALRQRPGQKRETPPGATESQPGRVSTDARFSVAGEVEGWQHSAALRVLSVITGWALVRGAVREGLRLVFTLRSPATVTLEGEVLRVVGHTEVLGRTLRTYDVRYPLAGIAEIRREERFAWLPVAMSVCALSFGAILGAQRVVEGARAKYFPLIGIGLGMIAGGIFFDFVLRALFPGVTGRCRVLIQPSNQRAVSLTALAPEEVDRLLNTLDAHLKHAP